MPPNLLFKHWIELKKSFFVCSYRCRDGLELVCCGCGVVSEKMELNQREMASSVMARDQWFTEKTELMTQLADVGMTVCITPHSTPTVTLT